MTEPFAKLKSAAVPLNLANIDTGQIFPSRFLRKSRSAGFQQYLFRDARFDAEGRERPDFILNQKPYREARILVAGANFGCGSSRESAVHALFDANFRCVIAPSFGELFYSTCFRNGLLPVALPDESVQILIGHLQERPGAELVIDLESQTVAAEGVAVFRFEIDASRKARLSRGLDDCALALERLGDIRQFERHYFQKIPWVRPE